MIMIITILLIIFFYPGFLKIEDNFSDAGTSSLDNR